ncbi:MAG TPA: intradiol ring-cleavage dioxygenase [Gammaproteobacteria bacterium]|nr:intradiol ring-cleavage dioxygenase [Gammaproteobacteria bacterium]
MRRTDPLRPTLGEWLQRQMRQSAWSRRAVLGSLGGLTLIGCSGGDGASGAASTGGTGSTGTTSTGTGTGTATGSTTTTGTVSLSCVLTPEETVGPYPLFNDIASAALYQREDITEGQPGLPLRLTLTIVNANLACVPVTTAMVYIWHCDKDGRYSGYNQPGGDLRGQTFCRGVQTTDANGQVRFTTVYPGWYQGRATHIHFRVYLALDLQATSQLAFPDAVTAAVYNTSQYAAKGQNPIVTLQDGIFSDGVTYQMPALTPNAALGGYDAALTVGIAA